MFEMLFASFQAFKASGDVVVSIASRAKRGLALHPWAQRLCFHVLCYT